VDLSDWMRLAVGLALVALVSACVRAPRDEDLIGIWQAENGSQLVLRTDGYLEVEQFDPGCWYEHEPTRIVSGNGRWTIPAPSYGVDPRTVQLEISSGARIQTQILYGGKNELLCVVGDPDSAEYVRFYKQVAGRE
jgi:hypothetical protein